LLLGPFDLLKVTLAGLLFFPDTVSVRSSVVQKDTFLPGPVNAPSSPYSTFQTLYASAQCQQQQLSTLHQLTKKLSTKATSDTTPIFTIQERRKRH